MRFLVQVSNSPEYLFMYAQCPVLQSVCDERAKRGDSFIIISLACDHWLLIVVEGINYFITKCVLLHISWPWVVILFSVLFIGLGMYNSFQKKKSVYFLSKIKPIYRKNAYELHMSFETHLHYIFHCFNVILQSTLIAIVQNDRSPCRTIIGQFEI